MAEEKRSGDANIPTLHVVADSIPEAYYDAIKAVHEQGYKLRTQYDRVEGGKFIDPPGRDAKVMVEIKKPFTQPRFAVLSYCERGKYLAEFLGAKNHLVVPYFELKRMVLEGKEFEATTWPYCYHQRLTAYPKADGSTIDQLEVILDKLARDPITRRAVAMTGVPEIDLFLKGDQPCLREIQLRAIEDHERRLVLSLHARWRSRDLYKAWGDNLIGITSLQARLAHRLAEKTGREVVVGSYTEENGSLHIYGQDYTEKGMDKFFTNFPNREDFVARATDSSSKNVIDFEVIPQLKELKEETTWHFPPESIAVIDQLIEDFGTRKFLP